MAGAPMMQPTPPPLPTTTLRPCCLRSTSISSMWRTSWSRCSTRRSKSRRTRRRRRRTRRGAAAQGWSARSPRSPPARAASSSSYSNPPAPRLGRGGWGLPRAVDDVSLHSPCHAICTLQDVRTVTTNPDYEEVGEGRSDIRCHHQRLTPPLTPLPPPPPPLLPAYQAATGPRGSPRARATPAPAHWRGAQPWKVWRQDQQAAHGTRSQPHRRHRHHKGPAAAGLEGGASASSIHTAFLLCCLTLSPPRPL